MYLASDNQLEDDVAIHFEQHLEKCPHCAGRFQAVVHVLTLVRKRCRRVPAPQGLIVRIRQHIRIVEEGKS